MPTSLVTSRTRVSPSLRERSLHVASPSLFTSSCVCSLLTFHSNYMVSFPDHPVPFLVPSLIPRPLSSIFRSLVSFPDLTFSYHLLTLPSHFLFLHLLERTAAEQLQLSPGEFKLPSLKLRIDSLLFLPVGHQCCTSPHHSGSVCSHTVRCSLQPHWSLTRPPSPCKGPAVQ